MDQFIALFDALDATTRTNEKIAAMAAYFEEAEPADAAWTVYFLSGRRPKRIASGRALRAWAREAAGLPEWLADACHARVGDSAETVALLLPGAADTAPDRPLHEWVEDYLLPLRGRDEAERREAITAYWAQLPRDATFMINKLLTGGFRVGVSKKLLVRGLEQVAEVDRTILMHRLMGPWTPSASFYTDLIGPERPRDEISRPYPFCLAHPLGGEPADLGPRDDWHVEWKWDGIRGQLLRRRGETFLWSRGEELVTPQYPELEEVATWLPDGTVLDGEILAWTGDRVLPFGALQRRLGRKRVTAKLRREVPVVFQAYDLIETNGIDIRSESQATRRELLEAVLDGAPPPLRCSPLVTTDTWGDLHGLHAESRERGVEGFMLKRRDADYATGRVTGVWWKWKVAPFTVDAVLMYAKRGSGRRSSVHSDMSFGVRGPDGGLVKFAEAYTGLSDAELREVDRWIRRHTVQRYGPVREVEPEQVFEIAFENLRSSNRHKAGLAVRFPRIVRWRRDKTPADIDDLATLERLLDAQPSRSPDDE